MNIYQCISYLPIVVVFAILIWSQYAYVSTLLGPLNTDLNAALCILLYELIFAMFTWSYTAIIQSDPGGYDFDDGDSKSSSMFIPPINPLNPANNHWRSVSNDDLEEGEEQLICYQLKLDGSFRFCTKCDYIKPDRTHHCSTCNRCIHKMDHHCPWVNNCIGYKNQKLFLLFLIYGSLYCIYIFITTVGLVNEILNNIDLGIYTLLNGLLLPMLSGIFGLLLIIFTCMHVYYAISNQTTIESLEGRCTIRMASGKLINTKENIFNINYRYNLLQVFGEFDCISFLPITTTKANGRNFKVNDQVLDRLEKLSQCT
ncbi:DHHC palmitoyltransferase-domain-containing protein [Globomyces pollinis-pini]|nr:DHHC palmitoyltransferase-domain-containing protein [Globomyces pollinis-pini]